MIVYHANIIVKLVFVKMRGLDAWKNPMHIEYVSADLDTQLVQLKHCGGE